MLGQSSIHSFLPEACLQLLKSVSPLGHIFFVHMCTYHDLNKYVGITAQVLCYPRWYCGGIVPLSLKAHMRPKVISFSSTPDFFLPRPQTRQG